ncbi:MAG: hypothetical protein IJO31_05710 [Oscillospiraceae bacterium]|nr:hypothetical protein [Oscillospiraceae bacterium]
MSVLKFGWSEKSITPDKKISLAGQFAERISQYVEKPLTVTAMAVDSGEDHVVLVSCDLGSTGYSLVKAVRENIAGKIPGLDPMKVVLSAIHTHTGPVYPSTRRLPEAVGTGSKFMLQDILPAGKKYVEKENISANPEIATKQEVMELLVKQISAAVAEAWENRKPGSFINAFGRAVVGMCRRATYSDGSAQMWGDTNTAMFVGLEGGNDSGIELLYVFDEAKKLTGIVANLACPAQCVQHRLFVSPDFWGEVKMLLRKHFGEEIFLLAQCSAAGDQCPVDLVRWVEPESDLNDPNCKRNNPPKRKADPSMFDLAGMRKTGKRIAREIIDVYEEGLDEAQVDVEFKHVVEDMMLPLRRTTMTEVAAAKRAIKEYLDDKEGDVDYNDAANLQRHLGVLRRAAVQETVEVLPTEVHILRMGTIAIATNPFELFLDYGNQIKARSLAEQTFLIQLCCGAEGYLPTKKAEEGGHYSAFIASGQVGHIGGEQLVRQTLQEINDMFR